MAEDKKLVKLWLTDAERHTVMQWLQSSTCPPQAVSDVTARLNDYDQPEPDEATKQAVFEDLCFAYQDYSNKEVVRELVIDGWAPPDWQDHLDYMADTAEEDEDGEDD